MEEFLPSMRILEAICEDNEFPTQQYTYFPTNFDLKKYEQTAIPFLSGILHQIADYYRGGLNIRKNMNTQKLMLIEDGLRNAVIHGSKNKYPVIYALFLGSKGVCHGFKDGGNYFKSKKIKRMYENKELPKQFGVEQEGFSGGHVGVDCMYEYSDIIEVDITKGILYCAQLKSSLNLKD